MENKGNENTKSKEEEPAKKQDSELELLVTLLKTIVVTQDNVIELNNAIKSICTQYNGNVMSKFNEQFSIICKIEAKVDNLHRIFELAKTDPNELRKANFERKNITKRSMREDLERRKQRELANVILNLKTDINQN
ncbi:hypothetical protein [Pedobacter frigidisoli]|uniref:hypothetical protein n=1 Tax=Pedobacter frigidisoli TaxID=2530455 RepID=UPI00292DFDEC|nr:hypothetical protein [Pedobacter frigidisoli]